jgi:hypothetical protein
MLNDSPKHHGRAYLLYYPKSWKYGEQPKKTELGLCFFPADFSLEQAELEIKRKFPKANWGRVYDETAKLWASFSIA